MNNNIKLLTIEFDQLQVNSTLPFNIFLKVANSLQFELYLEANIPLSIDKFSYIKHQIENGGKIAIREEQKLTVSKTLEKKSDELWQSDDPKKIYIQEEIKKHQSDEKIVHQIQEEIHKEQEKRRDEEATKKQEQEQEQEQEISKRIVEQTTPKDNESDSTPSTLKLNENKINFEELSKELQKAAKKDDFTQIIQLALTEIQKFPKNIDQTTSNCRLLAKRLMDEDNTNNRITALCYFLAIRSGIKSHSELGILITAALLHDIGLTQLDFTMLNKEIISYSDSEQRDYEKHLGLTHHLLRKCQIDLNKRCINTILDHHEKYDGSGIPLRKSERGIEPLSQYLSLVNHVVSYAAGRINGKKSKVDVVAKMVLKGSLEPGLQINFPTNISENFAGLFGIKA